MERAIITSKFLSYFFFSSRLPPLRRVALFELLFTSELLTAAVGASELFSIFIPSRLCAPSFVGRIIIIEVAVIAAANDIDRKG